MGTMIRFAIFFYCAQAVAGLTVGFALPWLVFFGAR